MLFPISASAKTDAKRLISALDTLIGSTDGGGTTQSELMQFQDTIKKAYRVTSLDELNGRVAVALITDVRLADQDYKYFSFGWPLEQDSSASAIKVAILAYVFHRVDQDREVGDQLVDGVAVMDHVVRMIGDSDNESSNALVQAFGRGSFNQWFQSLGFPESELHLGRDFSGAGAIVSDPKKDNIATPAALAKLYFLLAQESDVQGLMSSQNLRALRMVLSSKGKYNTSPHFNDRLNGDPSFPATFYHKTGSNSEVIVDAGYASDGQVKFVMVAFDTKKDRAAMSRLGMGLLRFVKHLN